jgi:hypothetical protein
MFAPRIDIRGEIFRIHFVARCARDADLLPGLEPDV